MLSPVRKQLLIALIITLIAAVGYQYLSGHTNSARIKRELETKTQELEKKIQDVNTLKSDKKKLEEEKKNLEAELQAKRETDAVAFAEEVVETVVEAPQPALGGTCEDWIAQAGITELGAARELIRRESGCNPYAINPSSGACGIPQSLPCGKPSPSGLTCALGEGACQVRWMQEYVIERYGSWSAALAHHDLHNWY